MTVKDLKLYKEDNQYYLSGVFNYENENGFYELTVPKIEFPVQRNIEMNSSCCSDLWGHTFKFAKVDFGFCRLDVLPFNEDKDLYTLTCLEEKIHTMTLAEIERELGYKVKLKEENNQ